LDCQKPSRIDRPDLRLQHYLARCGLGSRRACELLMRDGRVMVNGASATVLGTRVNPDTDTVTVDGREARPQNFRYLLFNKPLNVICTSHDPQARRTFTAYLPGIAERLFSIGRLDRDSEGLLILTNDGDLAQLLSHPSHHIPKIYEVTIAGGLTSAQEKQMLEGIVSDGETLRMASLAMLGTQDGYSRYRVELITGRNRQIRRMFAVLGRPVGHLRRVAIGTLTLGTLRPGTWRDLQPAEVRKLRQLAMNRRTK